MNERAVAIGLSVGMGLGTAIGCGLMAVTHNTAFLAVGIGMGLSIGIAIGAVLPDKEPESRSRHGNRRSRKETDI